MRFFEDLYERGALGPFLVGVVSLVAAACFFRILLPIISAHFRLRDNSRLARMRMMQIVIIGCLVALLTWKGATWIDAAIRVEQFLNWTTLHWPSDIVIGTLILIGGIYVVVAFSTGRFQDPVVITPLDHVGGGLQYRSDVDLALQDARAITQRAEELDKEIRMLLTERARVLGDTAASTSPARGG